MTHIRFLADNDLMDQIVLGVSRSVAQPPRDQESPSVLTPHHSSQARPY